MAGFGRSIGVTVDGRRVDLPIEERELEYEGHCW